MGLRPQRRLDEGSYAMTFNEAYVMGVRNAWTAQSHGLNTEEHGLDSRQAIVRVKSVFHPWLKKRRSPDNRLPTVPFCRSLYPTQIHIGGNVER